MKRNASSMANSNCTKSLSVITLRDSGHGDARVIRSGSHYNFRINLLDSACSWRRRWMRWTQ